MEDVEQPRAEYPGDEHDQGQVVDLSAGDRIIPRVLLGSFQADPNPQQQDQAGCLERQRTNLEHREHQGRPLSRLSAWARKSASEMGPPMTTSRMTPSGSIK